MWRSPATPFVGYRPSGITDTWGGEIRSEFAPQLGDIVALEHWCSSGFANTDLDLQLKKHGIHQLIVIGLIAHACVEATVRYAPELGYEVTVVKDANCELLGPADARGPRNQYPQLRQCHGAYG
jgi:nicotinamidase-related amidase